MSKLVENYIDGDKLAELRKIMAENKLDAIAIPSYDEFQNEYSPKHLDRLGAITGFSGSNGIAVVTRDGKSAFFTDGRYLLQAAKELSDEFEIIEQNKPAAKEWFKNIAGKRLGLNPKIETKSQWEHYQSLAAKHRFEIVPISDILWSLVPEENSTAKEAIMLGYEQTGRSISSKLSQLINDMQGDYLLISDLACICWLLNIRGFDIEYTPFLIAHMILDKEGNIILFTSPTKVAMLRNITVKPLEQVYEICKELADEGKSIQFDPNTTAYWFYHNIPTNRRVCVKNPVMAMKARKNTQELTTIRNTHVKDGVALTKFLFWTEHHKDSIDELQAAEKLLEFRQQQQDFFYPSFATISAYGANGAIIHYQPNEQSSVEIGKDNLYLLDSGGQYIGGTTDVTRVICLGKPKPEHCHHFTLVLKGMIALSRAVFPKGTTGTNLDILARQFLWQEGKNYAHGTGHGVGCFLSVHEGPQRIAPTKAAYVELEEGMILSNEPGYYKEGEYGIRIENLLAVQKTEHDDYLCFETLTLAPIATNLIDFTLLTADEGKWLLDYQQRVYNQLQEFLSEEEKAWLQEQIAVITKKLK
jgi:Xaa-Pro aminopeptidase